MKTFRVTLHFESGVHWHANVRAETAENAEAIAKRRYRRQHPNDRSRVESASASERKE